MQHEGPAMKIKLVIASGVHAGREIPIAGPQFIIGRDPQCQLRPSSPAISKKHCGIFIRGGKVFIKDFGSTNGTVVNGTPVTDEIEVTNEASVQAGPLDFRLMIEVPVKVPVAAVAEKKPARQKSDDDSSDDDFAAFLLEGDEGPTGISPTAVPPGSTVMQMGAVKPDDPTAEAKPETKKNNVLGDADTRSAAADILRKYQRRPRS
jgi:pSer/pThr/pTyr-binding forkhead associated (FHA) protein